MNQDKVDMFIIANKDYFPPEKIIFLKEKLLALDESKFSLLHVVNFKEPTTILLLSIFLGGLGIDRFMLGDIGLGVLKLLTLGVCGVMWLIDLFLVSKRAREKNFNNIMMLL